MHKVLVEQLEPGLRLGKTVYSLRGEPMLARGVALSAKYISSLRDRGFHAVYILDGIADDLEPLGPVSERLRGASVRSLSTLYELMAEASRNVRDQAAKDGAHVLTELPLELGPAVESEVSVLQNTVEGLLDEVLNQETLAGLSSLKAHDSYTFDHSVDVAVYGSVLGHRLGLDRTELRDLALGCLLHDIGKMYIDERILTKPGKLDMDEFAAITQHTVLGFAMLRQWPLPNGRPAHVALQHHEKQDGTGYPNRLYGTNRVFRTRQERFDPRRISLFAELAAVADVCSALTSDRPYRAALPTPEVLTLLRSMAFKHLNHEAVEAFVSAVQPFPVGSHVQVRGGVYDQCVGVVVRSATRRHEAERPTVRLLFDPRGRSLDDIEVNLWEQPSGVSLHSLPESGMSLEQHASRRQAA